MAAALTVLALLLSPAGPALAQDDRPLNEIYAIPYPVVTLDLPVLVVLSGLHMTSEEIGALNDGVNKSWAPFITALAAPLGVRYNITLEIRETSAEFEEAYAEQLNASFANDTLGRVVGNYIGLFDNLTTYFPGYQETTPVPHADAELMTAWLANADTQFPETASSSAVARLFFFNPERISAPYYYAVDSTDVDTNTPFVYETINAWGGDDGVYFQDLRANPTHLGEGASSGHPANFQGQPPYWSYGSTAGERSRLIADLVYYIEFSIRILAAPSYAVTPYYPASFTLDVTLFDQTRSQSLFAPGGVGEAHGLNAISDVLDGAAARGSLRDLFEMAPITVNITFANRTSAPDIASALDSEVTAAPPGRILDPFGVNDALKSRWGVPAVPIQPGDHVVVPALLAVFDDETWVDQLNTRGATLQRNDGRAASIIIAADLEQLEERGLTETLVHEGGHALGLGHPHEMGYVTPAGQAAYSVDWLRDLSSTPMTYLPNYVDYTFDSFDKHAVLSGSAIGTLSAAYVVRQQAFDFLNVRHYNESTLPASIRTKEAELEAHAARAIANMSAGRFLLSW